LQSDENNEEMAMGADDALYDDAPVYMNSNNIPRHPIFSLNSIENGRGDGPFSSEVRNGKPEEPSFNGATNI